MNDKEFEKPDYCGDEDSPILGCVYQPDSFGYNIPQIFKYFREKGNGRTLQELFDNGELEQFRVK